jgi:hypothetical protein
VAKFDQSITLTSICVKPHHWNNFEGGKREEFMDTPGKVWIPATPGIVVCTGRILPQKVKKSIGNDDQKGSSAQLMLRQ